MSTPQLERPCVLLITTGVGPEVVTPAIRHTRPERVLIWHSEEGRKVAIKSLQMAGYDRNNAALRLATRQHSLPSCVAEMRAIQEECLAWLARSPRHRVVVDFTGGSKAMAAAMVLVSHRWECQFLNVVRLQGGEGAVAAGPGTPVEPAYFRRQPRRRDPGPEGPVGPVGQQADPYDFLAYQPVHDAVQLFNRGHAVAASEMLDAFIARPDLAHAVKSQLTALRLVAHAYACWDALRHQEAAGSFDAAIAASNDLGAAIGRQDLIPALQCHRELCQGLFKSQGQASQELILDLLANAERRARERRFDDAASRLYRAAEAMAQLALSKDHEIDARGARLEQVPKGLRKPWKARAGPDGSLKLDLQDAYAVLAEFDHDLGLKFRELKLEEPASPLSSRGQSILGHGFAPISEEALQALRHSVHQLAGEPDLAAFTFPRLSMP